VKFDEHPDWDDIDRTVAAVEHQVHTSPADALTVIIDLAESLPEDRLCQLGVNLIEPLLDLHWDEIGEAFESAARGRSNLRRALSCAWLDLDEGVIARLEGLIQPGEDIGRLPATDDPKPTWQRLRRPVIHDIQLHQVESMVKRAAAAHLPHVPDGGRLGALADAGAVHVVWPRFRCDPADGLPPFFRCALRLVLSGQTLREAVCELDLLVSDLELLPETALWRVTAHLRHHLELLPGVDEI